MRDLKYYALAFLTVLMLCLPTLAISAGYYTMSQTTAAVDSTLRNRLIAPNADYNYTYGDDKPVTYTLPWTFSYYGKTFSEITADTNGNIWFGTPNTAYALNLATATLPVLSAWNTDLDSTYSGGVYIQHKTAPERIVIEWQTKPYFEGAKLQPLTTFSVVLFQTGVLRVDYGTLASSAVDSGSGISKGDGVGTSYMSTTAVYGAANLANHAYLFTPQTTSALTVAVTGPGEILSTPGGICGATCVTSFSTDTLVTLTATPAPGSSFSGWSGACVGASLNCVVQMSSAKTATASFATTSPPAYFTIDTITTPTPTANILLSGYVSNWSGVAVTSTAGTPTIGAVTVSGNVWSCPVQLSSGFNNFTVSAYDALGAPGTVTGSVTYTPALTLALSTGSMPADYLGSLGVTVAGADPGSSVLVEQFVDRNRNGVIEANDYPLRSFTVVDGAATNGNTQGDEDSIANGSTTTSLDYRMVEDIYHAPGQYIFRATAGLNFASALFTVLPVGQPQSISGLITDGTTPIPGALVQLTDKWNQHVIWTTTNELGTYYLDIKQPGSYKLVAYAPNFTSATTSVALATSQNLSNTNLVLNPGIHSVTGQVINAGNSSGVSGVWVQARSASASAVAITAANGTYSMLLPSGTYSVTALAGDHVPGTSERGYVGYDNLPATVTVSAATAVPTLPLTAGTINFTGIVKDASSTPVPGIPVKAKIKSAVDVREPVTYSVSKADGTFSLSVFAGAAWDLTLDNSIAQTLGYLGTNKMSLNTASSTLTGNDISVKPITGWFQGTVTDSASAVLANVEVTLRNVDSSVTASVFTAVDGTYRIGAYAGTWYLDALSGAITEQAFMLTDGQTQTVNFVKDVTPPLVAIQSPLPGLTSDTAPLLQFTTNDGVSFVVKVDGVIVPTVSGSRLAALVNGPHTIRVEATDTAGNIGFTEISITVQYIALSISTTSVPDGYLTSAYNTTLSAIGGVGSYTWSVNAGSTLPSGMVLSAAGVLSGTPTVAGTTSVTFKVTDSATPTATSATKALSIVRYALPAVSTTTLASGAVGTAYSASVAATGGKATLTWTSTALPAGLALTTAGVISGTPTAAGTTSVTFTVTDANGKLATKALNIVIAAPALSITTAALGDGYLTTVYSQTLAATGGKSPYIWSLNTGSTLPAGLSVSTSGVISGTPTSTGTTSVTFKVTDSTTPNAASSTKAISIVRYALPSVSTTSLASGAVGTVYSASVAATGGKATLVWTSTALPAGLTMTTAGVISGTPTTVGTTSVTFTVTDANGKVGTKAISIVIAAPAVNVTVLNPWANVSATAPNNTTGTITTATVTPSAGSNRLLMVAVTMKIGTAANPTISATYGGVALTQIAKTSNTQKEVVWVGYLKEASIGTGAKAIAVTYSGATGNASSVHIKWSVFSNVNQTTPINGSVAKNAAATSTTTGTAVAYVAKGMTTAVGANGGATAIGTMTASPTLTPGTVTQNVQSSNTWTSAAHTAAGSYATTTSNAWTGGTTKATGLVLVSLKP